MARLSAIAVLAALWIGLSGLAAQAADRALLIGIGTYQNLSPDLFLHGPKNDVISIDALLEGKLGYAAGAIHQLNDAQATRAAILSEINGWLIGGTRPGDRVFLYFSGHGLQVKDVNGDEEDGMDEAISTYDIKAGETDWTNVILDDDIEPLLEKLKDRMVTVVIDACHSGTISRSLSPQAAHGIAGARFLPRPQPGRPVLKATRGLRIDTALIDKPALAVAAGITTWSAAAPYQVAWDDVRLPEADRHGVFTAAYIAGYQPDQSDSNGNGLISNAELFHYVTTKSKDYCASLDGCDNLDPQLEARSEVLGESIVQPDVAIASVMPVYQATSVAMPAAAPAYVAADPVQAMGDILAEPDTGDVKVTLAPGPTLKNGQVFTISVTSTVAGSLVLLDIDAQGLATQIFPNALARKITGLVAGHTLTIPDDYYGFDFEADGKGENLLVALVVRDAVSLDDLAPAVQGLDAGLDARQTLSAIVTRLQTIYTGDTENRGARWSVGTLKYTID